MRLRNHTIITIIDDWLTPISHKIVYRSVVLVGLCRNVETWGAGWMGSAARSAGRALGSAYLTPTCYGDAKSGRLSWASGEVTRKNAAGKEEDYYGVTAKFLLLHDSRRLGLVADLGDR